MCPEETFWTLFLNAAHWEFEIFLMLLFDVLIGALIWPFAKRHIVHHLDRDRREAKTGVNQGQSV